MELSPNITTTFFLLFLLLSSASISRGGSDVVDAEVYEIDYRGPETHSSAIPPPGRSHRRPFVHQQTTTKASPQSNVSRNSSNGEYAEKVHG